MQPNLVRKLKVKELFMMKYDPVANFAQQSIDIRLQSNSKKKQKIGRRSKMHCFLNFCITRENIPSYNKSHDTEIQKYYILSTSGLKIFIIRNISFVWSMYLQVHILM